MNPYQKYVLPRIIDVAMRGKDIARVRAQVVPRAKGTTLELGIGSGLNLRHYSPAVTRLYGVDPSLELQKLARQRAPEGLALEFLAQSAADPLPLADRSVDTVVVTWSLCSIPDPAAALRNARRVLRPGGELIFAEHGLAPDASVRAWQNRLNTVWGWIGGGCNLNRRIDALIRAAGFTLGELEASYLPGPRPFTYTYRGVAT
jgi:ubiquinone/menaquinone biosynthesis C-methylase UbiE